MRQNLKSIKSIAVPRIGIILAIAVLSGCATWNELNDPWLRSERIDFSKQGAIFGEVNVSGFEAERWQVLGYIKNVVTGKTTPLCHARDGFFLIVTPGKYQIYITELMQIQYGYYTEQKKIKLKSRSQVYEIAAGDAVYAGDIFVSLGQPNKLDLGDAGTWIGMALGYTERGLQIGHGVKDLSYQKLETLKQRHPGDDYQFKIQIVQLTKLD